MAKRKSTTGTDRVTRVCKTCRKRKKIVARGICTACYQYHTPRIAAGEYTWEGLEAAGQASPPGANKKRSRAVAVVNRIKQTSKS